MASDISFRSLVISQNIGSAAVRERVDGSVTAQGHLRQMARPLTLALGRAAGRHSRAPQFPKKMTSVSGGTFVRFHSEALQTVEC